jgi:hypothetical protein
MFIFRLKIIEILQINNRLKNKKKPRSDDRGFQIYVIAFKTILLILQRRFPLLFPKQSRFLLWCYT